MIPFTDELAEMASEAIRWRDEGLEAFMALIKFQNAYVSRLEAMIGPGLDLDKVKVQAATSVLSVEEINTLLRIMKPGEPA